MADMCRYMYDELTSGIPEEQRPSYNVWKREWSYQDKSRNSPKQQNGNDCGVFTLVSIYLLSRGVELSESSYDQRAIVRRKVRPNITYLILQKNQLQSQEDSTPYARISGVTRRRGNGPAPGRKRRRRRKESRIVPSGTEISRPAPPASDSRSTRKGTESKRSAASLAADDPRGAESSQRQLPPAMRRKKRRRSPD